MVLPVGNERFFTSTRRQIIALLRRASRTVEELAQALDLTDNAVRAHLSTLERDGLVQQRGVRRGSRRPAYAYHLTPAAEQLFPKAYEPVLRALLAVLVEQLPPAELEGLLRTVGRRLAAGSLPTAVSEGARLVAAVEVLNELGGLAELEEHPAGYEICGYSCPLAGVTLGRPEACRLVAALLSELVAASVREQCVRGPEVQCRFAVPYGEERSNTVLGAE
jgi:predicted ArsR family transcriptional regulator